MSFLINEFIDLQEDEIADWWLQHHYPNPGCPDSMAMVTRLVWVCHRVPQSKENIRESYLKATIKSVLYDSFTTFSVQTEPGKVFNVPCAKFYFPYKGRHILVPLSDDHDYLTDMQLIRMLYK